ncbi:unnamed protein product [Caenorhabditis brenneri]
MLQYSWTRDRFGDLVGKLGELVKSDGADRSTKSKIAGNENESCEEEFKNSTIFGMFETMEHSMHLEDEEKKTPDTPNELIIRFLLLFSFGAIAFFAK